MKKTIIISISVFTLSLILFSCKEKSEPQQQTAAKKVAVVEALPVEKTTLVSSIEITGTIEANIFTDMVAPVDGVVEELLARENQQVVKDKIIAVINPGDRVALITSNLLKVEMLTTEMNETGKTRDEYNEIERQLAEAKKNLDYAKNMYQTVPVICPLSGLVTHRWTDHGSQVSAREKLLTISDMNSLVIKAEANEKYFKAINQGRKLELTLNAYPGETLAGNISLVYPQIDPLTRNVKFDIKIINFRKKLLPGMLAQIKLPVTESEQALTVPEEAVLTSPDNTRFLFVVENDSLAKQRVVTTGISVGGKMEITEGVTENEIIVTNGQESLKNNMKIKVLGTANKSE